MAALGLQIDGELGRLPRVDRAPALAFACRVGFVPSRILPAAQRESVSKKKIEGGSDP